MNESAQETLDVGEDFYCMSFLGFMKENQEKLVLSSQEVARNFMNCFFILMIQVALVTLVAKDMIFSEAIDYIEADFSQLTARFILAILLHIQLEGEVYQAMKFIKFYNNHPEKFSNTLPPFLICLMQLTACLATEIINIVLICTTPTIMDTVMNFVALGVIAEIDNHYASSLKDFSLVAAVEEPPVFENSSKSIKFRDRTCYHKFIRTVYKMIRCFYAAYYFYFMPFTVVALTYMINMNLSIDMMKSELSGFVSE